MYWETLPPWFWLLYYTVLLATLIASIINVARKKHVTSSLVSTVFAFTIPVVAIFNSIGRDPGINEFEHLVSRLQQGEMWSIYVCVGYLFIGAWWLVLLRSMAKRAVH